MWIQGLKKYFFFLLCIKMPCISEKQNMEKYYIEVIVDIHVNSIYFWLNEKHIETKKGYSNLPVPTKKYDSVYTKHRSELVNEPK